MKLAFTLGEPCSVRAWLRAGPGDPRASCRGTAGGWEQCPNRQLAPRGRRGGWGVPGDPERTRKLLGAWLMPGRPVCAPRLQGVLDEGHHDRSAGGRGGLQWAEPVPGALRSAFSTKALGRAGPLLRGH